MNTMNSNEAQVSVISSYGGVRLWRIDPYTYCPLDPYSGKRICTNSQSTGSVQIQPLNFTGFNTELCYQKFAVFGVSIDYINEYNLALTVLKTNLGNVDTRTLQPISSENVTYEVLFINPDTLEFRADKLWQPEAPSPALVAGQLCPSQRTMPNLGSLFTESLVSFVLLAELPVNIVVGIPILLPLLNGNCPLLNRGHSLLKTCGAELLSLDDFFDSLFR